MSSVSRNDEKQPLTRTREATVSPRLRALDLFAGAGGLSTGLEMAGFDVLFANEVSPTYAQTLAYNHPSSDVFVGDIRDINADKVRIGLGLAKGDLDLLAGGPPCQGFSINAPERSTNDKRNHLFLDYLRFVDAFKPRVVLIENVPGIVSFNKGDTVRSILGALGALGYRSAVRILYAAHFGVPQMRWRAIFLATREPIEPLHLFPGPTHTAPARANFRTKLDGELLILNERLVASSAVHVNVNVGDAIGDLPAIDNGGGVDDVQHTLPPQNPYQDLLRDGATRLWNHKCSRLGPQNLKRLPHIKPGGSWRDIPFELLPEGMKRARRSDHTKRYGRLALEGLGSTILTKCDPHWGTFIHPEQDRVLSVREAARIQSFPDKVRFFGSLTEQYEQVGNAVPPLFARALGHNIRVQLGLLYGGGIPSPGVWKPSPKQLTLIG